MSRGFYNYDTRGASAASQIVNLERMLEERDAEIERLQAEIERLREDNEQFAALVGQYAAEQAPDALRMVVKDRDALQAENEKLREALQAALDGGCSYVHANEDDEIGRHGCCDALSYKPHEPDCWTLKAKAALRREEKV